MQLQVQVQVRVLVLGQHMQDLPCAKTKMTSDEDTSKHENRTALYWASIDLYVFSASVHIATTFWEWALSAITCSVWNLTLSFASLRRLAKSMIA